MQPPQPPEGFPAYNDPLPNPGYTPGGYQPGGYSPNSPNQGKPPRGHVISFDAISEAWGILTGNIGIWLGATVTYIVIIQVVNQLQRLTMKPIAPVPGTSPSQIMAMAMASNPLWWVWSFISMVVSSYLMGGLYRMAIQNVRTGRADFGLLFSAQDVLLNLVGAALLQSLAFFGVGAFFILPGVLTQNPLLMVGGGFIALVPLLLLGALFLFVHPLIVDRKLGAFSALSTSFNTMLPQMWPAAGYLIVLALLMFAGMCACCVGFLFTFPLFLISIAVTYKDYFGGVSNLPEQPFSGAPIADPNA